MAGGGRGAMMEFAAEVEDLHVESFQSLSVIGWSNATKQSTLPWRPDGLLRGACHRARIRATRWLAMTGVACPACALRTSPYASPAACASLRLVVRCVAKRPRSREC